MLVEKLPQGKFGPTWREYLSWALVSSVGGVTWIAMGIWILFLSPLRSAAYGHVIWSGIIPVILDLSVVLFFAYIYLRYLVVVDDTVEICGPFGLWKKTIEIADLKSFFIAGTNSTSPALEIRTTTGTTTFVVNARFLELLGHRRPKVPLRHAWKFKHWGAKLPLKLVCAGAMLLFEAFCGFKTGHFVGRSGSVPISDSIVDVAFAAGAICLLSGLPLWGVQTGSETRSNQSTDPAA
jgi:hypothetical protein